MRPVRNTRPAINRRSFGPVLSWLGFGLLIVASPALAEDRIGNAAISQNSVERVLTSMSTPIKLGDDVFSNEKVRTGVQSSAKFVFTDTTNLAMGPTSAVTLDRFVYSGQTSYAKAAVKFTTGAFRFTTGSSEKNAYQIKTDTATIGVRGTVFDVRIDHGVTTVTLVEGAIAICPRSRFDGDPRTLSKAQLKSFKCQELTMAGQTARVTARQVSLSSTPFSFASNFCSGGGGLCEVTTSVASTGQGGLMCYIKQ